MPVYEYICEECESVTEAMRPMAQADEGIACERCGSTKTHRTLSVFMAGADKQRKQTSSMPVNACGRCGDPRGSCGM